ncbi:MAG: CoA pyrophosphatase [Anaerolineaceae bacterium]|nr:CoA pyrophosphatase [Anaerolineaceae bacterium]
MDSAPSARFGNLSELAIREVLLAEPVAPEATIKPDINVPIVMRHKSAAVLVPLIAATDGWQVLFTRRTNTVKHHKGLVSFPGGGVDEGDQGPADTAMREAWEEIGLPRGQTRICGYMDNLVEISGYTVTPVVGIIPWPFEVRHSENEVYRTFTIPFDWLADEKNYRARLFEDPVNPAMNREVVFYDEYDGETVWGLTAYITIGLVYRLQHRNMTWTELIEATRSKR